MTKLEGFSGGNPENIYGVHCLNPDGSLKSRDEVFEGMAGFAMMSQNMDREAPESAAKEYMSKMPAWSSGSRFRGMGRNSPVKLFRSS